MVRLIRKDDVCKRLREKSVISVYVYICNICVYIPHLSLIVLCCTVLFFVKGKESLSTISLV